MRAPGPWRTIASTLVALWLGAARADAPPDGDREQARALLRLGNDLLDQGAYLGALARFEEAYARYPSARLHFNIAQALHELGREVDALEHYQAFLLGTGPEELPALRSMAQQRIEELGQRLGQVVVEVNVVGARVAIDGRAAGRTPLARPLRVLPGAHAVVVAKDGHEPQFAETTAVAGQTVVLRIALRTEQEAQAALEADADRRVAEERARQAEAQARQVRQRRLDRTRRAGWWLLGAAVAAGGVGGVCLGLGQQASRTVDASADGTPWTDLRGSYDRAVAFQAGTTAAFSVAGAAVVSAAVLLVLGARKDRGDSASVPPATAVSFGLRQAAR